MKSVSSGIIVALAAVSVVGCDSASTSPDLVRPTSPAGVQSADECIAGWAEMGMWLPDQREVCFFSDTFDSSSESLFAELSHPDYRVRMRAAYVIDKLGAPANVASPHLLSQLEKEENRLVRMYLLAALATIQWDDDRVCDVLTERFEALSSANVPLRPDDSYAEVDEKIEIAATLYTVTAAETKEEYRTFVTDWLKPPPEGLSKVLLDGYWERRRIAVMSLERMPGAVEAVPLLKSLRKEPDAKLWVHTHVPRLRNCDEVL